MLVAMERSPHDERGLIPDSDGQDLMFVVVGLVNRDISIDQVERDDCLVAEDGTVGIVVSQDTLDALS